MEPTQERPSVPYEAVERACDEAMLEPERAIRAAYSGRAMYGRECLGIVHDYQGELLRFVLALTREDPDAEGWLPRAPAPDSMGRSAITYWPGVRVTDVPGDGS